MKGSIFSFVLDQLNKLLYYNYNCCCCCHYYVTGHHTSEYRRGYTDGQAARSGSGNTRNTSPELPTNRGPSTAIGSSGIVDSSGICNTVQILLIQSSDQLINSDHSLTASGQHAMGCIRNGLFLAAGGQVIISIPLYYSCYLTLQYQCQQQRWRMVSPEKEQCLDQIIDMRTTKIRDLC